MGSIRSTPESEVAEVVRTQAEQAYTPGPWSYAPAVPAAKRYFYISGNHAAHNREVDIGTVQGGYYSCEANARLIAAAPDLLEALKEARATVASMTILDMSKGDVPMHPKMLAMIDAAIAKATKPNSTAQGD